MGKLGLTLAPASRVAGRDAKGVVVTGVESTGVAAEHGFTQGDVILSVNGKQVGTPADVRQEISNARKEGRKNVLMHVKTGDNMRFVPLPIGEG
jgi:serine protease Do